jgi:hypothetical protein
MENTNANSLEELTIRDREVLCLIFTQQFPEESRDRRFREDYNGESRPSKQKEPVIG